MSHPLLPRVPHLHNRPDKKCHTLFSQGSPLCTIGKTKNVTPYSPKGPPFAQYEGQKMSHPILPRVPPLHNRPDKKCHTLFSQGSPLCTIGRKKNVTPHSPKGPPFAQ